MAKQSFDFIQLEENHAVSSFHNPVSKGRQKQTAHQITKQYESFDEWDDAPIETFQKFSRRSKK